MLTKMLHRLVAQPWVYDQTQRLAGLPAIHRRLGRRIARLPPPGVVLDLGGGTGITRGLWPRDCTYICLDVDPLKLRGFRKKHPAERAIQGDATRIPLRSGSVDTVLCKFVSHHLPDALFPALIGESIRVLRPGGLFIFLDAVWAPRRLPGRLLWRLDRGAYPRSAPALRAALAQACTIRHWERFAIYHEYVLCVGIRPAE